MDGQDNRECVQADMGQPESLVKITARIDKDVDNVIRDLAEEFGTTVSQVVRLSIDGHLERYLGTLRYVDKAQGEKIRKCICVTANKLQEIKDQLRRIGININQLAKYQNIGAKIDEIMDRIPYMSGKDQVEMAARIRLYRERQAKLELCGIKKDEMVELVRRYEAAAKKLGDALWHIHE